MNLEKARFNMIEQQIRTWDVLDQDVLDLLLVVKREAFVPEAYKSLAFVDTQIPLPDGEFMFAPKMEARILQEMDIKKHEHVLEIGTGSGYMAALLAHKARHVTTVEIDPVLKALAEKNLAGYGVSNVDVVLGNGGHGWPAQAPYDAIVISGSLRVLPEEFLQQVKVGGRIFAIIGEPPVMSAQITTRTADAGYETTKIFETEVKPLRDVSGPSQFRF
jgi:protein-L-isoaspartate(D-aspartate) O-methyltransferase